MGVQWPASKITEIKGLTLVQHIVNEASCIFNKVDGTNDIGIDGYVEFTENNSPTGLCVGVQIKAGNSNISKDEEYVTFKSDKNHFELWFNHILPIIGIVYIPDKKLVTGLIFHSIYMIMSTLLIKAHIILRFLHKIFLIISIFLYYTGLY